MLRRVWWARSVFVLFGLVSLPSLSFGAAPSIFYFAIAAFVVSLRAPLLGLLLGSSVLLPKWATMFAALLVPESRELLLDPTFDTSAQAAALTLAAGLGLIGVFAVVLWRGIAAAATLHDHEGESWPLLRTALLATLAMAFASGLAFLLEGTIGYYATAVMLAGTIASLPAALRGFGEWGEQVQWRRVSARDALYVVCGVLALAAFTRGYVWFAAQLEATLPNTLGWRLPTEWSPVSCLAFFGLVVPLVEELVFRGFVQGRLERFMTPAHA